MIHELRTYSFLPTDLPKYLKIAEEVGRPIRGNDYGVNLGYWTSEFGRLNQVWHLWEYASLDARQELRVKLSQNKDWTGKYVAEIRNLVKRQDIRLMHPQMDFTPPQGEGNFYEYRNYRVGVGQAPGWIKAFKEGLTHREKYSKICGLWHTEAGQPNEISHMWSYPDLKTRADLRAQVAQDDGWKAFLKVGGPMLEEMNSIILLPTNYSPSK